MCANSTYLGSRVWFSWVPSKANIADLPSRNEFSLLQELGSDFFDPRLPAAGASWRDVLLEAKRAAKAQWSRSDREWHKRALDAIDEEARSLQGGARMTPAGKLYRAVGLGGLAHGATPSPTNPSQGPSCRFSGGCLGVRGPPRTRSLPNA